MFASHPQLPATAGGAGVPNRRRPEHSALPHRPSANLSCRRPGRCCAITQHQTAAQTAWRGHRMTQTADPGAAPERSSSAGMRRRTTRPPHGEASGSRGVGMPMAAAAEASCPGAQRESSCHLLCASSVSPLSAFSSLMLLCGQTAMTSSPPAQARPAVAAAVAWPPPASAGTSHRFYYPN